ncbi:hypothetical protein [Dongia sp.]|uniref:hypothetical protein n=1 Tax=Dongia sp. TaxID=1977262 RepID=UPI0035AF732E
MNNGLFGSGWAENTTDLVAVTLDPSYFASAGTARKWANPFMGPCLVQIVWRILPTGAGSGLVTGDLMYVAGQHSGNGGSEGLGYQIEDCSQNIVIRQGTYLMTLFMDGTSGDSSASTGFRVFVNAVGLQSNLLRGFHGRPVKKYVTHKRQLALNANYSFTSPCDRAPAFFTTTLFNKIADAGYKPGEAVQFDSNSQGTGASNFRSCYRWRPGAVDVRIGNAPIINHKTTGVETTITAANWEICVNLLA